jgi:2-polyprenyl-6-hydroxyphenyl methylase/3-demethylubiquinone-9 3-methyltransferase
MSCMPADNGIYDRLTHTWWDDDGILNLLSTAVNPARVPYFRDVLRNRLAPQEKSQGLDVGCGGGILTEELARSGHRMVGVDLSHASVRAAREHAAKAGLSIRYIVGSGEGVPFRAGCFDFVCCCDVLEHVPDVDRVLAEAVQVLRPGGVFLYDTINRTLWSRLVAIRFAQEWGWSRFLPAGVHSWRQFIRPQELATRMARHGIENRETLGMKPAIHPLRVALLAARLRRGRITYGQFGRAVRFHVTRDTSVSYLGYGVRLAPSRTA